MIVPNNDDKLNNQFVIITFLTVLESLKNWITDH